MGSAIWGVRYMGCPLYGVFAIQSVFAIWGVRYREVSAIERYIERCPLYERCPL